MQVQRHSVQVWQRSNWHWYLKQELQGLDGPQLSVCWEDTGLRLHMCGSSGQYRRVILLQHLHILYCPSQYIAVHACTTACVAASQAFDELGRRAGTKIQLKCVMWQVGLGAGQCVSERGTAVVIDGARLLVTPLRLAAIPPPLSAVTITLPGPASCATISNFGASEVRRATRYSSNAFHEM